MKHKRSHKELRQDTKDHFAELAERKPSEKEKERFRQPAYQSVKLIQEQGQQMEHKTA